ncbi:MAG: DUF2079 domain-containing protein [Candidatus Bathyarchaeia archaeon]
MVKLYGEPLIYITVYFVIVGKTALFRHWLFQTYANDLGIFVQALSTTAKGEGLLYETPDSHVATSYLGIHFSPILITLVPFALVFPPAEMLLLLQTIMLSIPAYFIYAETLERTGYKLAARVLTIVYLANPALHGINLYDFHMHSTLLPLAYLFVKYARKLDLKKSIIVFFSMLTVTEHSIILGIGYSLYILLKSLERRKLLLKELIIAVASTLLAVVIAFSTITFFGKPPIHPQNRVVIFDKLGKTWSEVLSNLFSPKLIEAVIDRFSFKVYYWLSQLFLLFLLSTGLKVVIISRSKKFELALPNLLFIIKECVVFFLPWLAVTLLTSYIPFITLGWHLNAIALGPIAALMPPLSRNIKSRRRAYAVLLLMIAYSAIGSPLSPIPYVFKLRERAPFIGAAYDFNPWFSDIKMEQEIARDIRRAISMIPPTASVLASQNIFPHIATRANVYVNLPPNPPDYIIFDERFFTWWSLETQHWVYQQIVSNSTYVQVYRASVVVLLKRI